MSGELKNKNSADEMAEEAPVSVFTGAKYAQEYNQRFRDMEKQLEDTGKTKDQLSVDEQFKIKGIQH